MKKIILVTILLLISGCATTDPFGYSVPAFPVYVPGNPFAGNPYVHNNSNEV